MHFAAATAGKNRLPRRAAGLVAGFSCCHCSDVVWLVELGLADLMSLRAIQPTTPSDGHLMDGAITEIAYFLRNVIIVLVV